MPKPKIILKKTSSPTVTIEVNISIGSYVEKPSESGYAHFIEHLLLEGTKTRTAFQIAQEIESVGGEVNASTSIERTRFYAKVPSQYTQKAIDIISDIITNPLFDEKIFEKEKKIVLSEIKMYKDDPKLFQWELMESKLFDSSLKNSVLGSEKTIKNATVQKIRRFYKKHYVSKNVTIAIVGGFKDILPNFNLPLGKTSFICKEGSNKKQLIIKKRKIEQTYLLFGWKVPKRSDKQSIVFDILQSHLGRGASGKLFDELRNKRGVGYTVYSTYESGINVGAFFISISTTKTKEVKKLVEKILKNKLCESELKSAKTHLLGSRKMEGEDSKGVASEILDWEIVKCSDTLKNYSKLVKKVSLKEINSVFDYFNNPTIVEIRPL